MMSIMRVSALSAFLLSSVMFGAPNPQAQACGSAFAEVKVSDSEGRSIPDVTIELMVEVADEKYQEKVRDETALRISPGEGIAFKIFAQDVEEMIKQSSPISRTKDICDNPLRQQANSTKVRRYPDYQMKTEASTMNFGFCTKEGYTRPFLLKISAPGYENDYYLGPFLGGCRRTYEIVLTRKK